MKDVIGKLKSVLKRVLPEPLLKQLKFIYKYLDLMGFIVFLPHVPKMLYFQRVRFAYRLKRISINIECPHTEAQIISFINSFLSIPSTIEGCIVEAGSYKGGSAAKFSIGAKLANRQLVVFDSFQGLPENEEPHDKSVLGHSIKDWFKGGIYCGTFDEVLRNIEKYGEIEVCKFIKGWFEDTMPIFSYKICGAYLDVDLASSTKTCLKYLYPLIVPGGVLYSQDGDFPLVIEVFSSDEFWEKEVGCPRPFIEGLGKDKLIKIVKPISQLKKV
ncbi:MAG TPA: methyltransferase [Elusimicrobia bacterium]|jgi:O-methyltransferase|nr:methyltransferase [Elusimicrobiota bacterium]